MFHYRVILSYDGTRYFGWQKTRMGPSIQESLEMALARLEPGGVATEAASRTDRGVHANGQVVSFLLQKEWEPERLRKALGAHLPADIRVKEVHRVPPDFHPTLQAHRKEYRYRLALEAVPLPMERLYSWHIKAPLDLLLMQKRAQSLLGTHDFTSFANEPEKDPICTLDTIEVMQSEIRIRGNRFLYKMVRNLVGTLVYIGCGKLSPDCLPTLLGLRDRTQAGVTAPAHGLFLHRVEYLQ